MDAFLSQVVALAVHTPCPSLKLARVDMAGDGSLLLSCSKCDNEILMFPCRVESCASHYRRVIFIVKKYDADYFEAYDMYCISTDHLLFHSYFSRKVVYICV